MNLDYINKRIFRIRKNIIKLSYRSKSAHLGSSLSSVEILVSCLLYELKNKISTDIIMSKGHAAMAYYSALFEFKKISRNYINNYLQTKSKLWGHVTRMKHKNFKFSFGSLGYGPGIAAGLALGYKLKSNNNKIFCIISDGELNEGSIWESLSFISHHKLKNIIILLDKNNIQSFGFTKKIISYPNLKKVFSSLGFYTTEVDGHNVSKIYELIVKKNNKPKVIICNTIKGKGIPEIQNKLSSHYIPATIEQTKIYEK